MKTSNYLKQCADAEKAMMRQIAELKEKFGEDNVIIVMDEIIILTEQCQPAHPTNHH